MKHDQEQKCHVCRFCKRSFSNGKKLGGHMRGHLALIHSSRKKATQKDNQESINGEMGLDYFDNDDQIIKKSQGLDQDYGRKQGVLENDQEFTNGEKGTDFDDADADDDDSEMVKKSQQEMDFDQDFGANVYGLRENPKRSWRVSNSSNDFGYLCETCGKEFNSLKALAGHKRCHSRKESIKNTVCEKCGKAFDSMKALYGHMRSHSIKRSQPLDESSALSSSSEEHDDGRLANPVRKKRSCTRYKSPKPNNFSTSLSSQYDDNEDEVEGAICLMMLSRGLRNLDGVKLGILNQADIAFSDSVYSTTAEKNVFEVSVDGSMEFSEVKNKSKVGMKKELIFETGSGQLNMGRVESTLVKYKSTKKLMSCDQDFGDRDAADSGFSLELKRRSKEYNCPICFKKFGCSQALGSHKRVHYKTESKAMENDRTADIRTLDLNFDGGIDNGDVEFKLMWIQRNMEWDPLTIRN